MENEYWSNLWEGTIGFLKTTHNGKVPEKFYKLVKEKPKFVIAPVCLTSAPMTQAL